MLVREPIEKARSFLKFFVRPVPNDEDLEKIFELGWISRFGYLEIIQFVLQEFVDQTGHFLACCSCVFFFFKFFMSGFYVKQLFFFSWLICLFFGTNIKRCTFSGGSRCSGGSED